MDRRRFFATLAALPVAAVAVTQMQTAPSHDFPELNFIDFDEPITGIVPYRDDFLVFTKRAVYQTHAVHGPIYYGGRRLHAKHIIAEIASVTKQRYL